MRPPSLHAAILIVAALMGLLFLARPSAAVLTCGAVIQDLKSCLSYLQGSSGLPPPPCCSGAKALASAATTVEDRKAVCGCLESASKNLKLNAQLSQDLPNKCGINFPYPISPSFDCNSIK